MNQKIISIGAIVIAVAALLLSAFALLSAPEKVETLGVTNFDAITLSGDLNAANVTATSGLSGATLTVNGLQQSGAVKYGTASTVITGTTIAHGLGITPTVFLVQSAVGQATTFTQTIYGFGCNTLSCTVGVSSGSVITFTTVHWIAGK